MQVLKSISAIPLVLAILCGYYTAAKGAEELTPTYKLNPSWSSKRIDATLWGLALGDIDGDGQVDLVLLERESMWRARIEGNELVRESAYKFPPSTQGLRIFTMDVDGSGGDEVVVSAVAFDHPSSMILKYDRGKFHKLAHHMPWHLRVIEKNNQRILVGQRSSLDEYFTGEIYQLTWSDRKFIRGDSLSLPPRTKIFEFNFSPRPGEKDALISLKEYDRIKAYEQRGSKKKWKRFWISGSRFGGTLNIVEIVTRPPTQDLPRYEIPINKEPITLSSQGASLMIAAKQDLPLKNIIGTRPLISGSSLVQFMYDPALGYRELITTERLPGFVADFAVDQDAESGKARLYVALQTDPRLFQPGTQSTVVVFNLATFQK